MRAWLTPEAATGTKVCRRLSIPVEILAAVTGALERLTHDYNWEAFGSMTPAAAAALALEMLNTYTQSAGECSMVGEVTMYFGENPPAGCLACDGTPYPKSDYPKLWEVLSFYGSTFEDDSENFIAPDLRGQTPIGAGDHPAFTNRVIGIGYGAETHTLITGEMPAHNHTEIATGISGLFVAPGEVPAIIAGAAAVTGNTGGGAAFDLLQPSFAVNYAIRYE